MPTIHDALQGPDAVHQTCFVGAADPAGLPANQVGPLKLWLDTTGVPWALRIRNAANSAWDTITVTDHGALTGLGDDDHPLYLKAALVDAKGDLLVATAPDVIGRLAAATNGQVLSVDDTQPTGLRWIPQPSALVNPMTAAGDLMVGLTTGIPGRLGVGAGGQVLTVVGGTPGWAAATGGMANPMTAAADLIAGGTSGAPARLGVGTNGQVLTVVAGALAWAAPTGGVGTDHGALEFTFGDGVGAIVAASEPAQWLEVPYDATITAATLTADAAGAFVVDVQVTDYAGWPADGGDSICPTNRPTLAAAAKSQITALTGWTPALVRGQFMRVEVASATTVKRVVLSLALTV